MGATLAPQSAHLVSIGLETLTMRLRKTCANAQALAKYLSTHKGVDVVYFPGLEPVAYTNLTMPTNRISYY